jgi:hypothetical protein
MKQYKSMWLLLAFLIVGNFALTSCVDYQDNPSGQGGGRKGQELRRAISSRS